MPIGSNWIHNYASVPGGGIDLTVNPSNPLLSQQPADWVRLPDGAGSTVQILDRSGQTTTLTATATLSVWQVKIWKLLASSGNVQVGAGSPAPIPTYSLPARVPRTLHKASAALPAASAYDATAAYVIPDGTRGVTFYVDYTAGANVACKPKFKIMVGDGTFEGQIVVIDPTLTATADSASQPGYRGETTMGAPGSGANMKFVVPVLIRGGETTIRLLLAEAGNAATPGTASVYLTAQP